MKKYIQSVLLLWALIMFAFWIVSACTWVSNWTDSYRYTLLATLLFALVGCAMANMNNEDKKP